ncbi:hypothetical protein C8F01DRAFT_1066478 [Mycena amicta]|nr:hypothetical protein C8F01DRAFT_1066478 [Mycena amicta]
MPKRIPTPEPGPDEPKYFTVVQPFPPHAHWLVPEDCREFGRWIACCMNPDVRGEESFLALFYKPSARSQVIIEIARDYEYPERLLGEHKWGEFLKKPVGDQHTGRTMVFYSTYNSGRAVQKDGWKKIEVQDSWFQGWRAQNCDIRYPYPLPVWCPLPPEDRTGKPMCRPLPTSIVAPPVVPAAPRAPVVPGSATWATQKDSAGYSHGRGRGRGRGGPSQPPSKTVKNIPATSTAPWHTPAAPTTRSTMPMNEVNAPAALRHIADTLKPRESENAYIDEYYDDDDDEEDHVAGWQQQADSSRSWNVSPPPSAAAIWQHEREIGNAHTRPDPDDNPRTAICPVPGHGRLCKMICLERAKMVRKAEREKQEAKKGAEKKAKQKEKNKLKRNKGKQSGTPLEEDPDYNPDWGHGAEEGDGSSDEGDAAQEAKYKPRDNWRQTGNGWGADAHADASWGADADASWRTKAAPAEEGDNSGDGQEEPQERTTTPKPRDAEAESDSSTDEPKPQKEEKKAAWTTKRKPRNNASAKHVQRDVPESEPSTVDPPDEPQPQPQKEEVKEPVGWATKRKARNGKKEDVAVAVSVEQKTPNDAAEPQAVPSVNANANASGSPTRKFDWAEEMDEEDSKAKATAVKVKLPVVAADRGVTASPSPSSASLAEATKGPGKKNGRGQPKDANGWSTQRTKKTAVPRS